MLSKKDQVVSRHPRRMQKMPSQFVQFPVVAYIWQPAINDVFAMAGALETMRQQQHNRWKHKQRRQQQLIPELHHLHTTEVSFLLYRTVTPEQSSLSLQTRLRLLWR